jgi:hypothetical protein
MAEITLRLRYNLQTGRKDLFIDYHSDDDALPIEHEQDHRAIVESLLGKGVLKRDELGEVVVRRAQPQTTREIEQDQAPEGTSEGQG